MHYYTTSQQAVVNKDKSITGVNETFEKYIYAQQAIKHLQNMAKSFKQLS